jgi:hypothetical protein
MAEKWRVGVPANISKTTKPLFETYGRHSVDLHVTLE